MSLFLTMVGCRSLTTLYFHPSTHYFHDPKDHGLSYDTINLTTSDGETLSNWLFHPEGKVKGRVVFFHGNAENISTHFGSIHWLPKAGYEVLAVDYRGFGKSTGVPILPEILADMQMAYQWMLTRSEEDKLPVFVLGQSIGASLTTMAVAQMEDQPECIVLDAGFASFSDMARISSQRSWLFWPFAYPASWLLPSDLNPEDYAGQVQSRVLQFHSPDDQVVPYDQGRLLMSKLSNVTWLDSSGPHITTFNHMVNRTALLDFYGACSSR